MSHRREWREPCDDVAAKYTEYETICEREGEQARIRVRLVDRREQADGDAYMSVATDRTTTARTLARNAPMLRSAVRHISCSACVEVLLATRRIGRRTACDHPRPLHCDVSDRPKPIFEDLDMFNQVRFDTELQFLESPCTSCSGTER